MIVYTSKALRERYPHITTILKGNLGVAGIEHEELDTSNIWVRDFMPIRTNSHYTKFQYKVESPNPYPQLNVAPEVWHPFCDAESPLVVLDGGNVEQGRTMVLMTEMVLKHNAHLDHKRLMASLESTFNREILLMPVEPYDTLGHIDGIARFVDDKTVLVNDYFWSGDERYADYQVEVAHRLHLNGFEVVELPNAYHKRPKMTGAGFRHKYPLADDFNPGYGYYINFYKVEGLLFMPIFNIDEDIEAYKVLARCYPKHDIIPVNCSELSMEGGLCNCVTWEWEKPCRA